MNELSYIIVLPILAGILLFLIPEGFKRLKGYLALGSAGFSMFMAFHLFFQRKGSFLTNLIPENTRYESVFGTLREFCVFGIDPLSNLLTLLASIFGVLILIYSLAYINKQRDIRQYYSMVLISIGLTTGALLTDNLLVFIVFWGILGITLYKLIRGDSEEGSAAAKKSLIMIGASDGIMLLGIAIIWRIYGSLSISSLDIPTSYPILVIAFFSLVTGSFTKAGAFPLHTWIPDYTRHAPASASALLPASLDKLLGIYFLSRICLDMFRMNSWICLSLLIIGVLTIIIAVMMALVQHNYKKLLGYHAVSQVGYMVVGLALGSPLGIAGGLFHMINNALYKSGLFLVAGNVEEATGKEELDETGGLSKAMPFTFLTALLCALAISGVPPLNGFASKWLIYQGIIDFGKEAGLANQVWFIWLGLAVIGSALTLASFIKFVSGLFLGSRPDPQAHIREVSPLMWIPGVFLALVCLVSGIFASSWVIPRVIMPLYGSFEYPGIWSSSTVSLLILSSIILGVLIYLATGKRRFRRENSFIGGETEMQESGFPVGFFYSTIQDFRFFSVLYKQAEKKWFDLYDITVGLLKKLSHWFSMAHTGILTTYLIWFFTGLVLLIFVLMQNLFI